MRAAGQVIAPIQARGSVVQRGDDVFQGDGAIASALTTPVAWDRDTRDGGT